MNRIAALAAVIGLLPVFVCCSPDGPAPSQNGGGLVEKEFSVIAPASLGSWNEGDSITVADAKGDHLFKALLPGAQTGFAGEAAGVSTKRYAVFPASQFQSYRNMVLSVRIPSSQSSFEPLSVATYSDEVFEMKEASASISFSVRSTDIVSVVLEGAKGESLSGTATVSFNGTVPALSLSGNGGGVELIPSEGSKTLSVGDKTVSCLPVSLPSGIKVTVNYLGGVSYTSSFDSPGTLVAGKNLDLGFVEKGTESRTVSFSCYNGTLVWPFASPESSQISSSFGQGLASFKGQEVVLKLPDKDGGYEFRTFGTTGMAKHSTQGLRFGGAEGDYMDLPAFDGLFLSEVRLVSGATSTSLKVCAKNGTDVLGGQIESVFSEAGNDFAWTLYGAQRGAAYRLVSTGSGCVSIRQLTLKYESFPPEIPGGSVKVADVLSGAKSGEERYEAIYKAHIMALAMGREPDYSGVGTVELTVPSHPKVIPVGRNIDFKGTVFKVRDNVSDIYLFSMMNSSRKVTVTGKNIDSADYSSVPELASGLYVFRVQDDSLWVANREGYDYGATRRDAVLVRDGKGSCEPCYSYDTPATRLNCSYCPADDELKTFSNVSLIRDPQSTYKVSLLQTSWQNNLKISKIFIQTPQDNDWYGDHAISITNSTNILCEDITFDGTYSQTDHYGYGLSCNSLWNATFRRISSHSRWGVFGCNNLHNSTLEDSDCERFDTHCYGKNITVRNSTITGRGIPVSSIYGTILVENCKFVNCYFYSTRTDYNSYVPFTMVIRDSEITPKSTSLMSMGRLNTVTNSRPELAKKNWPDVKIENLTINVPSGYTDMYLFTSSANNLGKPLGNISEVSIDGLKFNYKSGARTVSFHISQYRIRTEGKFTLGLKGLKIAAPGTTGPANFYINVTGNPTTYSVGPETEVTIIE